MGAPSHLHITPFMTFSNQVRLASIPQYIRNIGWPYRQFKHASKCLWICLLLWLQIFFNNTWEFQNRNLTCVKICDAKRTNAQLKAIRGGRIPLHWKGECWSLWGWELPFWGNWCSNETVLTVATRTGGNADAMITKEMKWKKVKKPINW